MCVFSWMHGIRFKTENVIDLILRLAYHIIHGLGAVYHVPCASPSTHGYYSKCPLSIFIFSYIISPHTSTADTSVAVFEHIIHGYSMLYALCFLYYTIPIPIHSDHWVVYVCVHVYHFTACNTIHLLLLLLFVQF